MHIEVTYLVKQRIGTPKYLQWEERLNSYSNPSHKPPYSEYSINRITPCYDNAFQNSELKQVACSEVLPLHMNNHNKWKK